MTRLRRAGIVAALLAVAVVLWAGATLPPARLAVAPGAGPGGARPASASGIFHVHTTHSDGTGSPDEVAAAAARAGRQFVLLTDHGDGTRRPDQPRYRHGVLCLDGVEISTATGHYAVIGMGQAPYRLGGEARDVIEDVRRLGGFGVAAHPTSPRERLRWRDWATEPDGIEWLNLDSEWRDESIPHLLRSALHYVARRRETVASVFDRPVTALEHWDRMLRSRQVTALIASDAHARLGLRGDEDTYTGRLHVPLPSYDAVFGAIALNVTLARPFSGDAGADAGLLLAAIRAGHVFSSIDAIAGPAGFRFCAETAGARGCQGDALPAGSPVTLRAEASAVPGASMVLLKNGEVVGEAAASVLEHTAPGDSAVYRVEVRLPRAPGDPPVPWIVSNPIYVGPPLDAASPPSRPDATRVQAVAGDRHTWRVESHATSEGSIVGGTAGEGSLGLRFALGGGRRAGQFVALAHEARPPAGFDRLVLRASATRPMRASIQLRRPGPPDGLRWRRSIYLDQTPREITIFLDDLRPVPPAGALDLRSITALLVVVDTTNTPPGTGGTIWLDRLRWEGAEE